MRGYQFIEHTADVIVEACGPTIEEAFEEAAKGMYEVMTDISLVSKSEKLCLDVDGIDLENLLYRWLENLLIATDSKNLVFSDFKIEAIEKDKNTYRLRGCAYGEKFYRNKHRSKTSVKAVTYHQMRICEEGGEWKLRYTLDI
ncbi:MAG: archease [Fervidicoccaceae archaeon]|nr:archease [Fervidicoccaceae archaeon]